MNHVLRIEYLCSNRNSRSVATIPKSPREIIVGEVMSRAITAEALSRSKVRHTKCCDIVYFPFYAPPSAAKPAAPKIAARIGASDKVIFGQVLACRFQNDFSILKYAGSHCIRPL